MLWAAYAARVARYERAEAVAGGFNHLVQLQENQSSLRLPAPKLPFTGSESTFGRFRGAFLMSSETVCLSRWRLSRQPVLSEVRGRRSQQRKPTPGPHQATVVTIATLPQFIHILNALYNFFYSF